MMKGTLNKKIFETPVDQELYAEISRRLPPNAPTELLDGVQAAASLMLALIDQARNTAPAMTVDELLSECVRIAVHINGAAQETKQTAFPMWL